MDKKPKILLYDIETMANLAYVWGKYEQNVIDYESEWYMLTFAYKWLGEDTTYAYSLPDFSLYKKDKTNDRELVRELWNLFNEADIIIGHNSKSFDTKKANARFIYHGFQPPEPYKQVDTKVEAKKYFSFNSNKLDDLGNYFGIGRKIDTGGFDLWLGCVNNDEASWKKMVKYNKQDVILLEKVYNKLMPWMTAHPNLALLSGTISGCPNCGGTKINKRGLTYSRSSVQQRYQCMGCFAWSQAPKEGSQVR